MLELGDRLLEEAARHVRQRPVLRRRLPLDALAELSRNPQNDLLVVVIALHAVKVTAGDLPATHQNFLGALRPRRGAFIYRGGMADFPTLVIRSFSDLADAFRAVQGYRQISNECLEEISGLTKGAADKLLGPSRTKKIGPTSFDLLLGALGLELVVRPDPTAKVTGRWEKRDALQVRQSQRVSQAMLDRCRPIILAELIWQMGAGYKG